MKVIIDGLGWYSAENDTIVLIWKMVDTQTVFRWKGVSDEGVTCYRDEGLPLSAGRPCIIRKVSAIVRPEWPPKPSLQPWNTAQLKAWFRGGQRVVRLINDTNVGAEHTVNAVSEYGARIDGFWYPKDELLGKVEWLDGHVWRACGDDCK